MGNAPVDLYSLFIRQFRPARNLFKGAQATAAYIITQGRCAMAYTGTFGGNFFESRASEHGAIIASDVLPAPEYSATAAHVRVYRRTFLSKV
jgi:hypothetical protein